MLTQAELKEHLHYDPDTGIFTRIKSVSSSAMAGMRAGSVSGNKYRRIMISGKLYAEHRLAWLYVHGNMDLLLDHIDRDRQNNRISNLRPCTLSQNGINCALRSHNTSGHTGVCWNKKLNKWQGQIMVERKLIHLGLFLEKDLAINAYKEARDKYYPNFKIEL